MNKRIYALAVAGAAVIFGAVLAGATRADANQTPAFDKTATACTVPTGWYVNEDETARAPQPTFGGLKFSPSDLIHHAVSLNLADLHPGSFVAHPTPDQGSFFSVELHDPNGAYGTLRWNTGTHKWDITTSGPAAGQFSFTHPADVIGTVTKWGTFTSATKVISFGVGYTNTPPGTVVTTVAFVHFGGHTYDLRCKPVIVTHSPSPSPSQSTSAAPSTSPTQSAPPTVQPTTAHPTTSAATPDGALAVTGPNLPKMIGVGLLIVLAGLGAVIVTQRRRKTHFRP